MLLGPASGGLLCRDFDVLDSYSRWAQGQPDLSRTLPTVETGRGRHVYLRSEWTGFVECGDGELRGDARHYSILPPTPHKKTGRLYRWLVPLPEAADRLRLLDPFDIGLAAGLSRKRPERREKSFLRRLRSSCPSIGVRTRASSRKRETECTGTGVELD